VLKPIASTAETVAKPEMPIEEIQNKDNEVSELPPTTDVRSDLELSQDTEEEEIHGVHIVDLNAELDAEKPFIEFSDVEPDYTAEELAARTQQATTPATTTTLPEILFDFQEAVVISDDEPTTTTTSSKLSTTPTSTIDTTRSMPSIAATSMAFATTSKSILVTEPYRVATTSPTAVSTPQVKSVVVIVSSTTTTVTTMTLTVPTTSSAVTSGPPTSKTAVTSSKSPTSGRRPISSTASEDFPTRKPCQPEKPYNAARKIKTQIRNRNQYRDYRKQHQDHRK